MVAKDKCNTYVERDSTTGETYSDWRMPTLAEIYMIDILQNIRLSDVKKILEGGGTGVRGNRERCVYGPESREYRQFRSTASSVRCVRDVKDK